MIEYPVSCSEYDDTHALNRTSDPKVVIGLFDNYGRRISNQHGTIELASHQTELARCIAYAINQAYDAGQEDARRKLREVLGIEE